MLTKGYGVLISVAVDGTYRNDMNLVRTKIASIIVARPAPTDEWP
jgi:hypothetical protein